MQRIGGFVSLRALHIFQLRNEDTCVWVMRETKRFLIDNLSHHPELKLEWISIDDEDRVERIIKLLKKKRTRNKGKTRKSGGSKKGKQKEAGNGNGNSNGLDFPSSWGSMGGDGGWLGGGGGGLGSGPALGSGYAGGSGFGGGGGSSGGGIVSGEDGMGGGSPNASADSESSENEGNEDGGADNNDSSDDDDGDDEMRVARIETAGDIHFYDVYDVRIFKKEVVCGRL